MKFDKQLRLLDAHLRIVEATHDAMRIALESDEEESTVEPVEESLPPGPPSDVVLVSEESLQAPPAKTPSRRPTRAFPTFTKDTFFEHVHRLIEEAKTDTQRDAVRVVIERGIEAALVLPGEADELMIKLVPR